MKIAFLVEYDGTDFAGWQSQLGVRTVQTELESAMAQILGRPVPVQGAGRTDTGVHARGMVAHSDLKDLFAPDLKKLEAGLNATTGRDLVIHSIQRVADDFHARHSALSREYAYTLRLGRTAIDRKTQWAVYYELTLSLMREATDLLLGEHDFTSFSKRSEHVKHYRCIVERAEILQDADRLVFWIRANRFVRGMVRGIVGSLIEVGRGNLPISKFEKMLVRPELAERAKYLAPARGLVLERVRYPESYQLW